MKQADELHQQVLELADQALPGEPQIETPPSAATPIVAEVTLAAAAQAHSSEITGLLKQWSAGDRDAFEELMPLVFDHLRTMARRYLQREWEAQTLQTTALVSEVCLHLMERRKVEWENRKQFYGFIASQMRNILVDYARRRQALRRGGGQRPSSLDRALNVAVERQVDIIALNDALERLALLDTEASRVVELRFFIGLNYEAIADVMGISKMTARRRWRTAQTWLFSQLA